MTCINEIPCYVIVKAVVRTSIFLPFLIHGLYCVPMKPVISHISALEYWRSIRVGARSFKSVISPAPLLSIPPCAESFDEPGAFWLSQPLHVLVGSDEVRRNSRDVVSHIWKGDLPKGAILDTHNSFYVCSPEFTFEQVATMVQIPKLIEVGYDFCGTYDLSGEDIRSCSPLTSVEKLATFISEAEGMYGKRNASRALRYVMENSASPRETNLTMLLCLPHSLGGYNIDKPILNARIDLNKKAAAIAEKNYCVADLFWPDAKLVVEYDSDAYHGETKRISRDSMRRTALEAMGYSVIPVTNDQMCHVERFHVIALRIASIVGKRMRYKEPAFREARSELRKLLLFS